ncbi:hypothetical protein RRG08_066215 [Elysia crispata]|uniref:Uncharacterized protein n=1 Tax=Elysia crispata TaxID=231223 RepID=A0AAE1BCX3_9GAST|nr:hypothetical protein RRG08_066215 [Elysia crispata]
MCSCLDRELFDLPCNCCSWNNTMPHGKRTADVKHKEEPGAALEYREKRLPTKCQSCHLELLLVKLPSRQCWQLADGETNRLTNIDDL